MAEELQVPAATLTAIRDRLGHGRQLLEDAGRAVPGPVAAGEATALLTGMLGTVLREAAVLSAVLAGMDREVGAAGSRFWETDAAVAHRYDGAGVRGGR